MNQPDLFEVGFSIGPGKRSFDPKGKATARVLLKCSVKNCKFCKAADIATEIRPGVWGGSFRAFNDADIARFYTSTKCPTHPGAYLKQSTVEGTLSASHKCDVRCTSARGPVCVCSCGGANHGAGWL